MRMLSTFFPKHLRPRTVVHAGPLLLKRADGERLLKRFLSLPRQRQVFLVHQGRATLRAVARESGVADISVDATQKQEANAATEMALALGAGRLDFTIDEPCVIGPDGETLGEIDLHEAETLARDPKVRPRIRTKLEAGCTAVRKGVTRVRIGSPDALATGRATVLSPDEALFASMPPGNALSPAERERFAPERAVALA